MKIAIVSSAAIALSLLAAPAAHATVIASLGNNGSAFTSIGSLGTRVGGMVYTSDEPFADIPKGGIFNSEFLASGPSSGAPATITFNSALNYLSFLWGSPDTYNLLTLTTNLGNILTLYTARPELRRDGWQSGILAVRSVQGIGRGIHHFGQVRCDLTDGRFRSGQLPRGRPRTGNLGAHDHGHRLRWCCDASPPDGYGSLRHLITSVL